MLKKICMGLILVFSLIGLQAGELNLKINEGDFIIPEFTFNRNS